VVSGFFHLLSLARAGFVFAREGVLGLVDPVVLPAGPRLLLRCARLVERRNAGSGSARLAKALARLGPSYVKLGQFLATRPDVVGAAIASDLESLQDRMPPFPQRQAEAAIVEGLGKPVAELFAQFGPPVAAASIAQVHRAEVHRAEIVRDSAMQPVAVKVLRPGVEYRDLDTFFFAARLGERYSAEGRRLRLISTVETLARSVAIEMDLRLEAAAFSELAQNTKDDPDFRVPGVDWARTAKRVLTVEWVDGVPLNDKTKLAAAGFDFKHLARVIIQSFLRQALRDGFFHADMHPGNLFVDKAGNLVAVDCGIMGRLGPKERRFLAEILYGFIVGDWRRTAEVHFEAGYVPAHHSIDDFAQAIRAIGEPIRERPASEISMAKLLTLLFEVTAIFDMKTRPELLLLQKTMVVVEGVARSLDPDFDMWATAEPVVREWIERNLGPVGQVENAAQELGSFARLVGSAPSLLSRAAQTFERLDEQTRDGLVLSPATVEAIGKSKRRGRAWMTAALWAIALLIAIWLFR
jgi:ubiquinone biosynthesis protein